MSNYEKQNFVSGQILKAEHLNHMEDGIGQLSEEIAENKTVLENITVEGFRRIGGYENVKDRAELHTGKFVSTGDWDSSVKKRKLNFSMVQHLTSML